MNTNTNLSFLQSHSFPFFNRQTSNKDCHSDSVEGSSLRKSLFHSSISRTNLRIKYFHQDRVRQTKQCCKRFFTFLFSHIGLSAVLVGYVFIGGLMFQSMEVGKEIEIKQTVIKHRTDFVTEMMRGLKNFTGALINLTPINETNFLKTNQTNELEEHLRKVIINYTMSIIKFMQDEGWNGMDDKTNLNWSFEGALLYVITVITTIGYGHVAPKTNIGKFITMLYALLGIPLTFLYLSNIGDYLADWFRFIYHKVCRRYCKLCCNRQNNRHSALRNKLRKTNAFPGITNKNVKRQKPKINVKSNNVLDKSIQQLKNTFIKFPLKSKKIDNETHSRTQPEASDTQSIINSQNEQYILKSYGIARFLPSVKTVKQREALMMNCVSTHVPLINWRDIDNDLEIGSLDNIPNAVENENLNLDSDLPTISEFDINQNSFYNKSTDDLEELNVSTSLSRGKGSQICKSLPYLSSFNDSSLKNSSNINKSSSHTPDINFVAESIRQVSYVSINNIMEMDKERRNNHHKTVKLQASTVPISLSLAIILIYIIFGSVIFTMWEDKDYIKWSYFCFITLSTIGFGDIVPGTKVDSNNPKEKLIMVSVYVIIGLSVFAMCFKLMQEEVVAKFKRLGRKIGVLKSFIKINKNTEKNVELVSLKRNK